MGWIRHRRRRTEYAGRHRPGAWAEVALPPTEDPPAVPEPQPRRARRVDVLSEAAPPAVGERRRVRLGFADGSSVEVADGTQESAELRRLAADIIGPR